MSDRCIECEAFLSITDDKIECADCREYLCPDCAIEGMCSNCHAAWEDDGRGQEEESPAYVAVDRLIYAKSRRKCLSCKHWDKPAWITGALCARIKAYTQWDATCGSYELKERFAQELAALEAEEICRYKEHREAS